MKRTLLALVIAAAAVVSGGRAYAHHSFAATYFEDKTQKIEGKLVQFLFRNPHSFVQVEAEDEHGVMQRWAIEWGAGGQLGRQGVTRDTWKPGPQSGRASDAHGQHHPAVRRLEVGRKLRVSCAARDRAPDLETSVRTE